MSSNLSYKCRVVGLDYLRVSLALLIFLFHSHIHVLKCDYGIMNGFINMGSIAMTGFFLLSGYSLNLTNYTLQDADGIYKFYLKRLISILPLYYVYAIISVAQNIFLGGTDAFCKECVLFPIESFGIQSVFSTLFPYSHNGGSWFISCILICYFLYPLIQMLTRKLSDKNRLIIIFVIGLILIYSPYVQSYFNLQKLYSNPFFRVLEFTIGILVCQMNLNENTDNSLIKILRKSYFFYLTIIIFIVGVSYLHNLGISRDSFVVNCITLPCFISLLVSLGYIKFKQSKVLLYFSSISFAFFLSQLKFVWYGVGFVLDKVLCQSNLIRIILSFLVCFAIANFLHFCIELPSARYLKNKFVK